MTTTTVPFINSLSSGVIPSTECDSHTHNTEREYTHAHVPGEHGHTHEHLDHPGRSPRCLAIYLLISICYRHVLRTGSTGVYVTEF